MGGGLHELAENVVAPPFPIIPDAMFAFGGFNIASGGSVLVANQYWICPVLLPKVLPIRGAAIHIRSAAAGNIAFALYKDYNGFAGELVFESGEHSSATTGYKSCSFPDVKLEAGLYWMVMIGSGTPTVANPLNTTSYGAIGLRGVLPGENITTTNYIYRYNVAYSATFPSFWNAALASCLPAYTPTALIFTLGAA